MKITHFICYSTLVLISGISCRFSRNNLKRGIVLLAEAMAVTGATWFMDSSAFVRFGVLHFLGIAAVLWWLTERFLIQNKHFGIWFPVLMTAAYGVTYRLFYLKVFPVSGLGWLGFPGPGYTSTDYFPLIPFLFLYLAGVWLGRPIAERMIPDWLYRIKLPGFEWMGRYSVWIYLIHQPVLYGVIRLIAG